MTAITSLCQDFQNMSAGPRTFLAILLLATVTCIVLLQVSLDSWIVQGGFNLQQLALNNNKNDQLQMKTTVNTVSTSTPTTTTLTTSTSTKTAIILHRKSELNHQLNRIFPPYSNNKNNAFVTKNTTVGARYHRGRVISAEIEPVKFIRNSDIAISRRFNKIQAQLNEKSAKLQEILKSSEFRKRQRGDPMKAITNLPIIKPDNVTRILLITYFRTGSSFLGELLQQNWKTFYQFEPLHYMSYDSNIPENRTEEAFDLLNGIYRCNFTRLNHYLNWVRHPKNQFLFAHSAFLWFSCRSYNQMCFSPAFVSAVCSRAPFQVAKVLRLSMVHVKEFLEDNADLPIKVVYLTRDPRGIISSRQRMDWCVNPECSDPSVLCREMNEDMTVFEQMKEGDPSRFIKIRYEDIVLDPKKEAAKLFKFLHLPFTQTVMRFLKSHTIAKRTETLNPYSTRRNSSAMAYSWRQRLNFTQTTDIQESCIDVIRNLNFTFITSPTELENPSTKHVISNFSVKSSYNISNHRQNEPNLERFGRLGNNLVVQN